jgi:CYTH domain-containing protein
MTTRTKIERERKFVVSSLQDPSTWPVDFTVTKISQTYLKQERPGAVERIRVAECDGEVAIILCMKEHSGWGENLESETTIVDVSTAEWMALQERADPTRETIQKDRYTFDWEGKTFELDIFESPSLTNALLEVELDDMSESIVLPVFLLGEMGCFREVTGEPEWSNHQIALMAGK